MVERDEEENTDTEITLGMKSLLGVFFGLVLICGVFFGFGYSLGRGSSGSATPAPRTASAAGTGAHPSIPPSDQSLNTVVNPTAPASPAPAEKQSAYTPTPDGPVRKPVAVPVSTTPKPSPGAALKPPPQEPAIPKAASTTASSAGATPSPEPSRVAATTPASAPSAAASSPASAPTMVQIAAISHQADADVLVSALKRRGYNVVVRTDPKDSLLHVQIGPFATRDEAKAMRAKLLTDGYNAILK